MAIQYENRTALLARVESTYGVDSIAANLAGSPSAFATDAMMVMDLDVKVNTEQLQRKNYSPSLSQDNIGIGRMLASLTFKAELKASGTLGTAPRIGRLLRACGTAETIVPNSAAATIGNAVNGPVNSGTLSVAKTTAPVTCFDTYRITCTTGGAAATSKIIVTGVGFPEMDTTKLHSTNHTYATNSALGTITVSGTVIAPVYTFAGTFVAGDFIELFVGGIRFFYQVVTGDTVTLIATALRNLLLVDARFVGTANAAGVLTVALLAGSNTAGTGDFLTSAAPQPVTLGASGAVVTLSALTTLVAGDYWDIPLLRPGVRYDPVSNSFASLTFYVYLDGTLIRITGARGTMSLEGTAAKYATATFTFTGIYNDPINGALPTTLAFETSKPYKVELAQLNFYGVSENACASKFSFDMGITVEAKDCINASEAYDEIRITDRMPTFGADPQAEEPGIINPWWRMRREDNTRVHVAVGRRGGTGNIVRIQADEANFKDAPYQTRGKIRAYDFQMHLARVNATGNDEFFLHFG